MDDDALYGKEFYNISFGKAVELELLSDYKVLILTTPEKDVPKIVKEHWTDENGEYRCGRSLQDMGMSERTG